MQNILQTKYLVLVISLLFAQQLLAQNCDCLTALDQAATIVQSAKSYKDTKKRIGLDSLQSYQNHIASQITEDPKASINCLAYLERYLLIYRDKHLFVYPDNSKNILFDTEVPFEQRLSKFKESEAFLNTSRIRTSPEQFTFSSPVEGVYTDQYKREEVALIKDQSREGKFLGIVTNSNTGLWEKGQVKWILYLRDENQLEGIMYDDAHQPHHANLTYGDGLLNGGDWYKKSIDEQITFKPLVKPSSEDYFYEKLSDSTDYIYMSNFSGWKTKEIDAFYDKTLPQLSSSKLILDLRNNTGGGERSYQELLDFILKTKSLKEVIILQNKKTVSAAEQFILKMKESDKVTTMGETTSGMISYGLGNRPSPSHDIPCFDFKMTTTKTRIKKYSQYEIVGIKPDITLTVFEDWIGAAQKQFKD